MFYCFSFSAYIRFLFMFLIERNVNISSALNFSDVYGNVNFSDVYGSVSYIGSLVKFT